MIYAILSDVHANLEALEAVLVDTEEQGVERIVCLGDIVGYGPNPHESADLIHTVAAATVRGNHEVMVCTDKIDEYVSPLAATAARWTRKRLRPRGRRGRIGSLARARYDLWAWLSGLPASLRFDSWLFAHGTPGDCEAYIVTLEEAQRVFLEEMDGAQILFVGHSHVPGIFHMNKDKRVDFAPGEFGKRYRIGTRPMIVNVGSVGQPRDYDSRACYVVTDGRHIRYRRVEYDVEATVERLYKLKELPNALADRLLCGE